MSNEKKRLDGLPGAVLEGIEEARRSAHNAAIREAAEVASRGPGGYAAKAIADSILRLIKPGDRTATDPSLVGPDGVTWRGTPYAGRPT